MPFLEDEKIEFTLKKSFLVVSFFDSEDSSHDSVDDAVRILGRQDVDACFDFEVNALLDAEGLGKVKQETSYSLLKEDRWQCCSVHDEIFF